MNPRHPSPALVLLISCLSLGAVAAHAQTESQAARAELTRPQIESLLTAEMQALVNRQRRIEGQKRDVVVEAKLNASGDTLFLNLSNEYIPTYDDSDFEDLRRELLNTAYDLLRVRSRVKEIKFLFGGRSLDEIFREDRSKEPKRKSEAPRGDGPTVLVSAGHGVYRYYGKTASDWRPQRDPSNGITEDYITPTLTAELSSWLIARSSATVVSARRISSEVHTPSGRAWTDMAARYNLEDLYPMQPEIWNSPVRGSAALRERDQDIRSRPLYANSLPVSKMISIHTNAAGPAATGTRVFVQASNRSEDVRLGNNVLCYMKEIIRAREAYANYNVPASVDFDDNGETRLATMPSIIVEVGFHTNASDAAALRDPVFRTAAMKGVEKGFRLTNENKPCEPFALDSVPDTSGVQNVPIPVAVNYKGYPQFAVRARVDVITCPSGWTCSGGELTYANNLPSPLRYTFTCTTNLAVPTGVFRLRTTLIDLDEVKTNSIDHAVSCSPAAGRGAAPSGAPVGKPTFSIGIV